MARQISKLDLSCGLKRHVDQPDRAFPGKLLNPGRFENFGDGKWVVAARVRLADRDPRGKIQEVANQGFDRLGAGHHALAKGWVRQVRLDRNPLLWSYADAKIFETLVDDFLVARFQVIEICSRHEPLCHQQETDRVKAFFDKTAQTQNA